MAITPSELFNVRIPRGLEADPDRVRESPLILQFNVTGPQGGSWTVDTVNKPASCIAGAREDAECVIEISDTSLMELIAAPANARPQMVMRLIVEGAIDMDGNVIQAMKLSKIFAVADSQAG